MPRRSRTASISPFSAALLTLIYLAVAGAILFVCAGTIEIPAFWAFLAELALLFLIAGALVYARSPDLIKERLQPGAGEQDRLSLPLVHVLYLSTWAVAGLDVGRYHWLSAVPFWLQVFGFVGVAVGWALVLWAMLVNKFFSSAVRLQADRGQVVVTGGPYHYVRHPGYTGGLLYLLCSPLALGSWAALVPAVLLAAVFVRRTLLEERMLEKGLSGYAKYAREVRYRLVPGLW